MLHDTKGRTVIYDAFVKDGFLYLVSTYYHYKDAPPMRIIVDGVQAEEIGLNDYEPVRYFRVPVAATGPKVIEVNGKPVKFKPEILKPRVRGGFAVATLFKNDYQYMNSMIEWYRVQGCTAFYLYFNGGALPPGMPQGPDIHYRSWNFRYWNPTDWKDKETGWIHAAQPAFLTMVRLRHMPDHDWIALVDIDEHVWPGEGKRLVDVLAATPPEVQVVRTPCHWTRREGQALHYALTPDPVGVRSKCIYRGSYQGLCGIHRPKDESAMVERPDLRMLHVANYWWMDRRVDHVKGETGVVQWPAVMG
jgi:hypothetical protein